MSKKVAIILTGCGYLDGAEINESVLSTLAMEEKGATYEFFSIDRPQFQVISHLTEKPCEGEKRSILEESARIARGKVKAVEKLKADDFDAIWLPGGYGVASNASDFAKNARDFTVYLPLNEAIKTFYKQKKPIVGVCIAPVIIAKSLENIVSLELTLGQNSELNSALKEMKMKPKVCKVNEVCEDVVHKVYTTPAYIEEDASPLKVFKSLQIIAEKVC